MNEKKIDKSKVDELIASKGVITLRLPNEWFSNKDRFLIVTKWFVNQYEYFDENTTLFKYNLLKSFGSFWFMSKGKKYTPTFNGIFFGNIAESSIPLTPAKADKPGLFQYIPWNTYTDYKLQLQSGEFKSRIIHRSIYLKGLPDTVVWQLNKQRQIIAKEIEAKEKRLREEFDSMVAAEKRKFDKIIYEKNKELEKLEKKYESIIRSLKDQITDTTNELEEEKKIVNRLKRVIEENEKEMKKLSKLESYPLKHQVDTFIKRLDEITKKEIIKDRDSKFFSLYLKLKEILQKTSKVPLDRREQVSSDVLKINQIETIIDVWAEKIRHVREDESLHEEEREEKIENLKRLQEKHISDIEGG